MTRHPLTSGWLVRAPRGPFAAAQGGTDDAVAVRLPHDALRDAERSPDAPSKGAGAYYPMGAYTYVRSITAPPDWADKIVILELEGAMRHAMVFVNDEFVGNRADGYARFLLDLTPYLRYDADNELRVEVRTGQDSRWYSGAGLHRAAYLNVEDPVHFPVDGVRITTRRLEVDQAVIEVATQVRNATHRTVTVDLHTEVRSPADESVVRDTVPVTVAPGETALVRQPFYVTDPLLWNVDTPHLYSTVSTLGEATRRTTFGIREVTVDPRKGLRINGEPVLLRGACIHHDNGPLGGAAIARAEERRIELLKAAGFNALRSAHNPMSVAMLDACDRLGMLVMDEAFDMWTRGKTPYDYALDFAQWWRADLESLVAKDINHPSVIMYSLGNEIVEAGTPHGARLARAMAEHVRTLDPTRLVTNGVNAALAVLDELPSIVEADAGGGLNEMMAGMGDAMNHLGSSERVSVRTAESSSVLDVLGLNYAEGRYALDQELFPRRVIVGSETFPSRIGRLWPMVVKNPNVIGDFTWTGWDYLGEVGIGATAYAEVPTEISGLEHGYPFLTGWCGDLDITGWRRPVSFYREIVFGLRQEPYLAVRRPEHHDHTVTLATPWAWSDSISSWTWPGFEGKPVTVEVYAYADEVVLHRDGTEVGRANVGETLPMLAVVETTYEPGELVAVAYRDGRECGHTSLSTAGEARLTAYADRSQLGAGDRDLAFVSIEWRDAMGDLVTSADAEVTVTVEGAAELAGLCSANPSTTERFDASTWRTFDGRALAVIRPSEAGVAIVSVTAVGHEPVTLQLTVEEDPDVTHN